MQIRQNKIINGTIAQIDAYTFSNTNQTKDEQQWPPVEDFAKEFDDRFSEVEQHVSDSTKNKGDDDPRPAFSKEGNVNAADGCYTS